MSEGTIHVELTRGEAETLLRSLNAHAVATGGLPVFSVRAEAKLLAALLEDGKRKSSTEAAGR